ncbi:sn-glycerol-3-phosphate ABC transporter permease UgpE [Paludibacterium paludis]|uniref:sn-glycerol-3-phosphate transport system permease protein UgpE n=1 Tax=Paludibacterium paludis TaxID=1225769 RepID=A0A918UAM0_9NEIS|nr:sn-glycerol-3-phosphate ABC transporter permease UgpE [Paludibacterium paludis]GGY23038.1 sn-glycerol-3-phosphate transport system permease protein UgpE [Paludibacterium paludis]
MIENRKALDIFCHCVLTLGMLLVSFPLILMVLAATHRADVALPGPVSLVPDAYLWENLVRVMTRAEGGLTVPLSRTLFNSFVMAMVICVGKIVISVLSAFAIVYFRFPLRRTGFVLIFATLMLPVEVRIFPTVEVISRLDMINSYGGLTVPLIASATSTFLLRQFYLSLPVELAEAARVDGAGPMRFLFDIVLPLTRTTLASLFVVNFIYGWNQYLWPLLVSHDPAMSTAVIAIKGMLGEGAINWPLVMAGTLLTLLPPLAVVIGMQRWFVKGLVDSEK